jgi:hypothetical protein
VSTRHGSQCSQKLDYANPQEILIESVWMHRLDGDFSGELSISLEISTIA